MMEGNGVVEPVVGWRTFRELSHFKVVVVVFSLKRNGSGISSE
jgi:hypothetical protein